MDAEMYEDFVLWACSLGDPFARPDKVSEWRASITVESILVGEFLAQTAAAVEPDDRWRACDAEPDNFAAWWDDCYPVNDPSHIGALMAPVPTAREAEVICWAFGTKVGMAPVPAGFTLDEVEWAVKELVARFRAVAEVINVREYLYDCAIAAWSFAEGRESGSSGFQFN